MTTDPEAQRILSEPHEPTETEDAAEPADGAQ